jgi:hypothetical protein
VNREQLEALLPQIEAKEKQEEAQRQGMKEKKALLYRAGRAGLIPQPKKGRHWWSRYICQKCGSDLDGRYDDTPSERRFLVQCRAEACDYEYLS